MQELYYIAESSSLTLQYATGESKQWNAIDSLVVSNAKQQIIAESASVEIVVFPIDGTNIYYTYDIDATNNSVLVAVPFTYHRAPHQ